jgi:hypothetical protein
MPSAMRLTFTYLLVLLPLACGPGTGTTDASSSGDPSTGLATTGGSTTGGPTTGEPVTTTGEPVTTTGEPGTTSGDPTTTGEPGTTTTTEPGTTSLETTGAPPGEVECEKDADCKLNQDCCSCDAIPVGEDFQGCAMDCRQPLCAAIGVTDAVCNLGVCEAKRLTCDPLKVACDQAPPDCPDGELPSTTPACWTGLCVPAALCDVVPDCSVCPDHMMCVQKVAFVVESSCQPIPLGCDGEIACECVSDLVCTDEFSFCSANPPVVSCECINC